MREPQNLHPTDLSVSLEPELRRGALGLGDRVEGRPDLSHIVWIGPLHDLFDMGLILGNINNFLKAHIPRDYAVKRIVLPRPEMGCVHGKL
jgi:hypothetical protein